MRDGTILEGFNQLSAAISSDQKKLQSGFALMRTRVDALETLMLGTRFGIVKVIFLQMISPALLAKLVQRSHSDEIRRFNIMREAQASQKPKVKTPPAPVITKVI